jgi:DNA-binding response OmpR family regulator
MKEKKRIALFTDNMKLAETLRLNLEDEGYCVFQVAGAEEDLKKIKEKQINLLIFDLDVPVWRIEFIKGKANKSHPCHCSAFAF